MTVRACPTTVSDMTTVERRTFQRNPAEWLNRAEAGEEVVIQSRGRTPLTIKAGRPAASPKKAATDWDEHFRWRGPRVVGVTSIGRATIRVLAMNGEMAVQHRKQLIAEGSFPPKR